MIRYPMRHHSFASREDALHRTKCAKEHCENEVLIGVPEGLCSKCMGRLLRYVFSKVEEEVEVKGKRTNDPLPARATKPSFLGWAVFYLPWEKRPDQKRRKR